MLRKSRKGQSLVEFALILPVFLLLLLGVVEGARIVWSFITVQTAAREAARYAITGRPYVSVASATFDDNGQAKLYCDTIEGEPDYSQPWICNATDRLEAVKQVAIQRGRTLAVSRVCGQGKNADYLTYFDNANADGECADQAGAFGVLIIGQKTNPDGPEPTAVQNYPGDEGLNVSVATYYNVQMLDPIYDALLGGTFVRVQGRVEMQNEGIDKSLGAVPPPPLPDVPVDGSGLPGQGTGPQILPSGSNEVEQNEVFGVQLLNHRNPNYDIHLAGPIGEVVTNTYKICPPTDNGLPTLTTDANGNGVYDCRISTAVQPGQYRLYSTQEGVTTEVARYEFVTVNEGETPLIAINGGNTWAENTKIDISLLNHKVADQQFSLFFDDGGGPVQIGGPYDAEPPPVVTWQIPNTASATCGLSGLGCKIFSRSIDNPAASDPYAETDLFVIRPEIILSQGQVDYRAGETIRIALIGHTPNKQYEIQISSTPTGTVPSSYTAVRVTTDSTGQFSTQEVIIPEVGSGAWANGNYTITTHQINAGGVADLSNFIAEKDIRVDTPTGAYLTVDGGYTWPIDSFINIKVHQHDPASVHYLNFGTWRVLNGGSDTFTPSANGTATLGYRIPITAVSGTAQDFLVRSFLNSDNTEVARETVRVLPKPVIQVLEGDKALPDAIITIRILNHSPQSSYKIYYGKEVGNAGSNGKDLGLTMITDSNGEATTTYDLSKLPASPPPNFADPANCNCYGVPYEMYSESFFTNSSGKKDRLAFTQLTIDSADLAITQIQVPSNPQINTSVPVTLTIQNLKPVTIARYFDIDVYQNPAPLIPSYKPGKFNFPGDEKLWKNYVAPNGQPGDTFMITSTLFMGQYGEQKVYGYADTSDFVFAENSETNNIGSNVFQVACVPTFITDNFNSSLSSAWQSKRYNPTYTQLTESQTSGGQLRLTSDGYSTYGTDDDASNRGHALLYRTTPVSTTNGLDVVVRLTQSPATGKAGISLRDSIDDGRSRKVEFNIYLGSTVQVSYRDPAGADVTYWQGTGIALPPVWLRVQRLPGSDTFNFYYSTQTGQPTNWGTPYSSATIPMADSLYVGLFTASYANNVYLQSRFDDFSYTDPASCPAAQGPPPVEPPPGLTLCTDLLVETGFETAPPQAWFWPAGQNVNLNPSSTEAHSGLFSLDASSFDSAYNSPAFYQRFTMPSWVISSTTSFNVNLYRNVNDLGSSDPNDKFYAVVATTPAVASAVTTPTLVADGVNTTGWSFANPSLPVLNGTNLEPYAESDLYIYFYNNSNASGCNPQVPATCHNSKFLFDDVQLTTCTTQPPPDVVTTLLKGEVTLHRLGGSSQKVAGVKVWAYAENGDLYETFTDQNGNFSFYNLPATAAGVQYLIYSEHHVVDVFDATQIETLAADTSVILKSSNTQSKPLIVDLDLYTIVP